MQQAIRQKLSDLRQSPNMPAEFNDETRDRACPSCITRHFEQKSVNVKFLKRMPRRVRQAYLIRSETHDGVVWKPDACILCTPRGAES